MYRTSINNRRRNITGRLAHKACRKTWRPGVVKEQDARETESQIQPPSISESKAS